MLRGSVVSYSLRDVDAVFVAFAANILCLTNRDVALLTLCLCLCHSTMEWLHIFIKRNVRLQLPLKPEIAVAVVKSKLKPNGISICINKCNYVTPKSAAHVTAISALPHLVYTLFQAAT